MTGLNLPIRLQNRSILLFVSFKDLINSGPVNMRRECMVGLYGVIVLSKALGCAIQQEKSVNNVLVVCMCSI